MQVLILNSSYEPLGITSAKKALKLILKQKAEIIKHSQLSFRSETQTINAPLVVRLFKYIYFKRKSVPYNRTNVFIRDKFTCQYCGKKSKNLSLDHIIPRSKFGQNTWENTVAACVKCNVRKSNKFLHETDLVLSRKPTIPSPNIFFKEIYNVPEWNSYFEF